MSLLSYSELVELVDAGVIDAPLENVNAASIEVTLGKVIMVERKPSLLMRFMGWWLGFLPIRLYEKQNIGMVRTPISKHGYAIAPGEFILASTVETFNLPNDIVAEYVCKSSMCRNGLSHLLAGYADPGFNNSKLTLELVNHTKYHALKVKPGQKIGQMKFYRVKDVPEDQSYAKVGNYNNQQCVQESKGIQ